MRPATKDMIAAPKDRSAPILAASWIAPGGKATDATKSDTVNPMAATQPTTKRSVVFIPSGSPSFSVWAAKAPIR